METQKKVKHNKIYGSSSKLNDAVLIALYNETSLPDEYDRMVYGNPSKVDDDEVVDTFIRVDYSLNE